MKIWYVTTFDYWYGNHKYCVVEGKTEWKIGKKFTLEYSHIRYDEKPKNWNYYCVGDVKVIERDCLLVCEKN